MNLFGRRLSTCIALLLVAMSTTQPAEANTELELVLVVPAAHAEMLQLDRSTLQRLYLGRVTRVDGKRIECFAPPPGSPARIRFNREILQRSEDALAKHWIQQALLGGALPPREVATDGELFARLRHPKLAIGYSLKEPGAKPPAGLRFLPVR